MEWRKAGTGPGGEGRLPAIGRFAWTALGVVGVLYVAYLVLSSLAFVVVPVVLAFFVAAALEPLTRLLDRWHVPCPLAAVLAPFAAMAVIGGTFALVVPAFIAQAPSLVNSVQQAISLVDQLLASLPGPKVDVAALASRLAEQLFGGGAAAGTSGAYSWSRSSTQSASG